MTSSSLADVLFKPLRASLTTKEVEPSQLSATVSASLPPMVSRIETMNLGVVLHHDDPLAHELAPLSHTAGIPVAIQNQMKDFVFAVHLVQQFINGNVRFDGVAENILDFRLGEFLGIAVIAHGKEESLLTTLLEAVDRRVPGCKIPGQRIALEAVSATALLEVELGELLGDANITLKLGRLERMPIAHGVPDGIEHDLGVSDGFPIQNLLDQNAQLVGDAVEDVAHRAGHVQADDDCVAGGMVTPIAALPHLDVLGVKLGFHVGAGIYLGRAPPA